MKVIFESKEEREKIKRLLAVSALCPGELTLKETEGCKENIVPATQTDCEACWESAIKQLEQGKEK